ncbi:MAG: 3-oxoacyl-ACP reductase FabG [Fibrobacter sp.]|nr:3-oxoacyl-ACP reductase FabG [Fibrobacter sp.]
MENQVLITGASGGIGQAIAKAVAQAGYTVVAHYNKNAAPVEALAEEIRAAGGSIRTLQFNLRDREQCREVLEKDIAENGVYYGVVTNAGVCADMAFPAMTGEYWDKVIDTNLNGFYNVVYPIVMPMCRKKRGRIITMSSVSGVIGNRGQVNYSASKAGLIGATKALATELASRNITVNSIAPGAIDTEMVKDAPLDMILPAIPMKRLGKPEEVAATVVFLLSDGAAYITRQVISVNGGLA